MSGYSAPLAEMEFAIRHLADLDGIAALPGFEDVGAEVVRAVLEESARFSENVLAPLNRIGDQQGSQLDNGIVRTPDGWKEAYRAFCAGGWNGISAPSEHGGQGLPWLVTAACQEMWNAANLAFTLCPLLSQGAMEALAGHASDDIKRAYLPRVVSGEWAGTMNLTEAQAGSDLAAVRTRAVPEGDHYRIIGQKIFITYGDHDLADNIVHLVLARLPDAPAGVKGISLFVVPKFVPAADGSVGERNDIRTVSLEHKLGIHASPTAVLAYGDNGGAKAWLVGEPHRGLEYMFTMMNLERFGVGIQGIAIAERAYQQARAYAAERIQGRPVGAVEDGLSIDHHPDVRRMLLLMRSQIDAMRAIAYYWAGTYDKAQRHPDSQQRARCLRRVELLTPVVKGCSTEVGVEVASLGVQVHGGMGFIEETGAAQYYRDARITPIYEGTTAIQANDLVGRKVLRDRGRAMAELIDDMRDTGRKLADAGTDDLSTLGDALSTAIAELEQVNAWMLEAAETDIRLAYAASVPYLRLFGVVAGGWQMARAALAASTQLASGEGDQAFLRMRVHSALFYSAHVLAQAGAYRHAATTGAAVVLDDLVAH